MPDPVSTGATRRDAVLQDYYRAFAEHDAAARRTLLERCMTEDAEIWGPQRVFRGYDGIAKKIEGFHQGRPGQRLVLASGMHEFLDTVRVRGALVDAAGQTVALGEALFEFAADGRIARVFPMWESLPPEAPAHWPRGLVR